jgi:hypothetical protein
LNNADHSVGGTFSSERRCILFQLSGVSAYETVLAG